MLEFALFSSRRVGCCRGNTFIAGFLDFRNAARTYGELWTSSNNHVFLFLLSAFCYNWICGRDIAVNSMEFWKSIVSIFNGILSSTFILRENRNRSEILDSKLTIYAQDRWQLIMILFHNDVFTCHRAELKLRNIKSVIKRQAIAVS